MDFLYIKALHIIFIVTWFAGLFYIVRLFIYHSEANQMEPMAKKILQTQYKLMEKRLWFIITWPSAILASLFGFLMFWYNPAYLEQPWMLVKLSFVLVLYIYHFKCHKIYNQLQNNNIPYSSLYLRIWNEFATIILFSVVFLVTLKSAINWIWGVVGLILISLVLLLSIRLYKKIRLYNKAVLTYEDMTLEAGIIVLDYTINEVYAGRIADSTGILSQKPRFIQGQNEVNPDSIRFNFDTKKALIWNSKTEQSGMNVAALATKKENDSVYFIKEAKITTSKKENPDYYIRVRKGKFIPKNKIIAGLSNIYVADVPTPIFLPFAYFPLTQNRATGFIFPSIGQNNERGYFIQNGGYYFAPSDLFDVTLLADYYTNGSYGFRAESKYKVRYNYTGSLSLRFENLINGERGLPGYSKNNIYNIRWSHSQDSKSNPNSRFSASVNLGSSNYFRESVNQLNTPNFLNNTLNSSVSYSKTFRGYPSVNLSLTASHSQNTRTQTVNMSLPTLQANVERVYPFVKKNGQKKGILKNINLQYTVRGENRIQTSDSLFLKKEMFDDAKYGMKHSIPIGTNFKFLKHLSVSLSGKFDEVWTGQTIKRNNFDIINQTTGKKDTIKGFDRFNKYSFSASLGTTVYGVFNFKEGKKIQSIRHVMRPSVTYGINPSFEKYYDEYIIDANGNTSEYTRFEGGFFGTPGKTFSSSIGFGLSNVLEAKIKDKDSMKLEPKKIKLLNNLNFSTSYNIAADSLKWSPVRMTTSTSLFEDKLDLNLGATFDPYTVNENGRRINTLNINDGGGLFRMTSANINLGFSYSSKNSKNDKSRESDNSRSGGRSDDLFGRANDFADSSFDNNEEDEDEDENKEEVKDTEAVIGEEEEKDVGPCHK